MKNPMATAPMDGTPVNIHLSDGRVEVAAYDVWGGFWMFLLSPGNCVFEGWSRREEKQS